MIGTAMLFLWQEFWFGAAAMESKILSYEKTVPKRCVAILDRFLYLHWDIKDNVFYLHWSDSGQCLFYIADPNVRFYF